MNRLLWKTCIPKHHVDLLQGVSHWNCYTVKHIEWSNSSLILDLWSQYSHQEPSQLKQYKATLYLFQECDRGINFSSSGQEGPLIQITYLQDGERKTGISTWPLRSTPACRLPAPRPPAPSAPHIAQHCLCRCPLQDSPPSLSVSVLDWITERGFSSTILATFKHFPQITISITSSPHAAVTPSLLTSLSAFPGASLYSCQKHHFLCWSLLCPCISTQSAALL